MSEPVQILGPNDDPVGHPFASSSAYAGDVSLLNYLLQDLRALARRCSRGEIELAAQQVLTWDVHGLGRRIVVCDPVRLCADEDVHIVGFFGDRRERADQDAIDMSEFGLIAEFPNHPGLLSYSSIELVDNYWANLVVHTEPGDREGWRANNVHTRAVEVVAPNAYHAVRIHNGCLRHGVLGSETVVIETTKYWDYDVTPVWHAIRTIPGGAAVELVGPIDTASHPDTALPTNEGVTTHEAGRHSQPV